MPSAHVEESPSYPGERLGLPETGRGSLATWRARVAALLIDWAACLVVAIASFGTSVMRESTWTAQMPLVIFFVEAAILTAFVGGSFGQVVARVAVVRVDGRPLVWWQAVLRSALKCLVVPMLIVGMDRRNAADLMLGTVVVNRR
ncbi:RDD family protein [Propionibacteriaceae bacterium G1746]|uniref:RDD family protein n=1 Tax=Aestuariimicrobium sp. G57 TaxID=3418485 RepID=UPI003C25AAEC